MKYMGSKARISKYILPILLSNRLPDQHYVEPMCGGCNILDKVDGKRIANDVNRYLIAMFKHLQLGWKPPVEISRDHYADVRSCYNNKSNKYEDHYIGYVGFTGSFNGRFFDGGYSGTVNISNGLIRDYVAEARKNLMCQISKIQDVEFRCSDYQELIIPDNSIIYYDPPYQGVKKYSYSINHSEFWKHVRKQVYEGHMVFISEYNAPDDFNCIWSGELKTPINQTITKSAVEKLFVHRSQV